MRVVRRFLYPLRSMPGWCAKYAVVLQDEARELVWEGVSRDPSQGHR